MSDEPFGRQPKPVKVIFEGEDIDIDFWLRELKRRAKFKGDNVVRHAKKAFTIYPRAIND